MAKTSNHRTVKESVQTIFQFYRRTRKLARKIEYYRDKTLSDLPITGSQLYGLWCIYELEKCTNAQLADYSGLAKNSVTTLIKFLQKERYIVTSQDIRDARITTISITNKGLNIINSVLDRINKDDLKISTLVEIMSKNLCQGEEDFQKIRNLLRLK